MKRSNNRGSVVLGFVGICLAAFMGLAVVGVDFGHLGLTANEVQTVADVAATAGAKSLANNMTGGAEDPVGTAQSTVAQNLVDGDGATIDAGDVEVGTWASGSFNPGGVPANAVRATGRATVPNLIAGFFGDPTTDVTRQAIAAVSGNSSAQPVCPIAVDLCAFQQYQSSGDCSDLPQLDQVPSPGDNSGWTSLGTEDPTNANLLVQYMPSECGGGDVHPPTVRVHEPINLNNGQVNHVLQVMKNCWEQGLLTECTVPVVNVGCEGQFNQTADVVGFATFEITNIVTTGNPKYISFDGICKTDEPGAPGGMNLGLVSVDLVQ